MTNVKKMFGMVLVGAATMSLLAGCGGNNQSTQAETTPAESTEAVSQTEQQTVAETETSAVTEDTTATEDMTASEDTTGTDEAAADEGGKTLVVYYSASGNTAEVANTIAGEMSVDVLELVPTVPYSDEDLNYNDDSSRVSQENENPDSRVVELETTTVDDWESYDTVFIGYPIWWGIAAWPVNGFVEANDFTGKTVIPFCTAASSDIGESGQLLQEMAGTGDWLEGAKLSPSASGEDIQAWVTELGL